MALIVQYKVQADPKPVIKHFSGEYLNFNGQSGYLAYSDVDQAAYDSAQALIATYYDKYLLVENGILRAMTQLEMDAVDAAELAAAIASAKQAAKNYQDAIDYLGRLMRAVVKLTVDEINFLRKRDRDRSADVAAATNLANLQSLWAAQASLSDRTYVQAKSAIDAIVDGE